MATEEPGPNSISRANWPWILGCEAAGLVLIASALWLESAHGWTGVSEDILVSIGAALLLAGVLFFVNRHFLREVGEVAARTAGRVADSRIAEQTSGLRLRLDELSDRMTELQEARNAVHDDAVRAIDVPSFETIATALAVANQLGALSHGHVTVQGSTDPDELGLEFSWGMDMGDGRFSDAARYALRVKAVVYADFHLPGGRPVIEVEWKPGPQESDDEPADAVGQRLRDQLTQRGRWKNSGTMDWAAALRNLQRGLDLAIRSRRRDEGVDAIEGPLKEIVGSEWAITEAGLECPSRHYVFSGDEFPARGLLARRGQSDGDSKWQPERPEWVDEGTWVRLVERGRRVFPIQRGPMVGQPSWVPVTETPADLRGAAEG